MQRIGIMAAMHGELASLLQHMGRFSQPQRIGQRDYYEGELFGTPCVLVLARIGKVAAAATAVTLIREFSVDAVLFTGLAGAVSPELRVGDIVIGDTFLQYDLDVSPLFPRYEVPLLGRSRFQAHAGLADTLQRSAHDYLAEGFEADVPAPVREVFGVQAPQVRRGLIISGDCFVNCRQAVHGLRADLPDALCVEMEGAAVGQVCHEYEVPFAVVRTISDRADDDAGVDFSAFLDQVASHYSAGIVRAFLGRLQG